MNYDFAKTTAEEPGIFKEHRRSQNKEASRKMRYQWLWIVLSVLFLGMVYIGLGYLEDTADVTQSDAPRPLPLVSVEHISVAPQQVEIHTFAEVRPRWSAELTASVPGRIKTVFDNALAGKSVEPGTKLIEIENSRYVAELAAAEQANKEAKLALWQAKNATLLAQREFKRNNRNPPNELALKLPQLGIAESAVTAAESRVSAAKRNLDDTMITAPFTAYVTERFVSPGQSVSPGDRLVKLVDKSSFELVAEISDEDWALLDKPLEGQIARLLDSDANEIAKATIRSGGGYLDETTRQYRIFLEAANHGSKTVLSGDFVTVSFTGVAVDHAMDVPASALTQEGFLWTVDDTGNLQRFEPEVLFRRHDRVIIKALEGAINWRVAVAPLLSYLPGQHVEPRSVGN